MDFVGLVASLWATPINFIIILLVVVYVVVALKEATSSDEPRNVGREVGVICGDERKCEQLALAVNPAERFELARSPAQILEQVMRRNMILLFIVEEKLSDLADSVVAHLQNAYDADRKPDFSNLRYAVFGIGNTMNEDFNALAIEIDLRLRKIGATKVAPLHLFDNVTTTVGLEQEFMTFMRKIAPRNIEPIIILSDPSGDEESEVTDYENQDDIASETEPEDVQEPSQEVVQEPSKPETEEVKPEPEKEVQRKISKQEKSEDDCDDDWEVMEANFDEES